MAVLSSVAHTSHQLLIRLLEDPQFVRSGSGEEMAAQLASISGVRNQTEEIALLLDAVAATRRVARTPPCKRKSCWESPTDSSRSTAGCRSISLGTAGRPDARCGWPRRPKQSAVDARRSEQDRVAAIRLLGCFGREFSDATLRQLLSPANPEGVQSMAVDALSQYSGDEIAQELLERWKEYTPSVRTEVVRALLSREPWTLAYLHRLQSRTVGRVAPAAAAADAAA